VRLHLNDAATGERLDVPLGELEGRYSNYLEIGQNAFEFVLAFGQQYEDQERAVIHSKIVATPVYAKRFMELLRESIQRHEKLLGPIPDGEPKTP
jgi:hypothetical protein